MPTPQEFLEMSNRKSQKILVIDDDALFLEASFHAIGIQNSLAAVKTLKQEVFDLILCDIKMPQLNGYEVLMAVRQDPVIEKTPFIFLVAERPDSDRRRAMELGANDYLIKPFTTQELIDAIKAQLERY